MIKSVTLLAFTFMAMVFTNTAHAKPTESAIIDISATTCRDLLKADGAEEQEIMIFFHGYISGMKNITMVDIDAFSEASNTITDRCIEAPKSMLLDIFKSVRMAE